MNKVSRERHRLMRSMQQPVGLMGGIGQVRLQGEIQVISHSPGFDYLWKACQEGRLCDLLDIGYTEQTGKFYVGEIRHNFPLEERYLLSVAIIMIKDTSTILKPHS